MSSDTEEREQQFLFGVEIEFILAYSDNIHGRGSIEAGQELEGKKLQFLPSRERTEADPYEIAQVYAKAKQHIALTCEKAGLKVLVPIANEVSPTQWTISTDGTLEGPIDSIFGWLRWEIQSPAMPFSEKSFYEIHLICSLLKDNYLVETNASAALHVHISGGLQEVLAFKTMQRLLQFVWAFEPQLDSLHPKSRQLNGNCLSLRHASELSQYHYKHFGFNPAGSMHGIAEIAKKTTIKEGLNVVFSEGGPRQISCNVKPAWRFLTDRTGKPIVEFRQHEGTLDSERICEWVSLIGGIAKYCQDASNYEFHHLIMKARLEKWHKTENAATDKWNRRLLGPILAEGEFTIIDILECLELHDLAKYYSQGRTHKIVPKTWQSAPFKSEIWIWEYEQLKGSIPDAEYQAKHSLRLYWESLQASEALKNHNDSNDDINPPTLESDSGFNLDDPIWPVHIFES